MVHPFDADGACGAVIKLRKPNKKYFETKTQKKNEAVNIFKTSISYDDPNKDYLPPLPSRIH